VSARGRGTRSLWWTYVGFRSHAVTHELSDAVADTLAVFVSRPLSSFHPLCVCVCVFEGGVRVISFSPFTHTHTHSSLRDVNSDHPLSFPCEKRNSLRKGTPPPPVPHTLSRNTVAPVFLRNHLLSIAPLGGASLSLRHRRSVLTFLDPFRRTAASPPSIQRHGGVSLLSMP
jgi:hypothetical protein